ncbi:hypothetical protein FB474_0310 [Oryzihumus leptocrescens]|uniref:Uncharacterized protein n=2 Tax=Oryzihumus leptocrescens TaxID=297536 RepID=A0A542ZF69_9MICO|nr:hypothetical protein FB474_0310 [Oryzihumus leptocrescens]
MTGEEIRPTGEQAQLKLPAVGAGRWRVRTETASYDLDLDAGTARRAPLPVPMEDSGWAPVADLRRDEEAIPLIWVLRCRVGESMLLALDLRGDGVITFRATTPVVLIVRIDD